jgi:hypothetical protein
MQSISEKPGVVGSISFGLISFAAGSISSFISFLIWGLVLITPENSIDGLYIAGLAITILPAAYVAGITTILLSFLCVRSTNKSGSKSLWTKNQVLGSVLLGIFVGPASGIGSVLLFLQYINW